MSFQEIQSDILKEKLFITTLDNGLKVCILPKEGYTKKFAIFATNYGSIDNKFSLGSSGKIIEVPEGIAHFLEHKLFESPEGGVFNRFSKLGSNVNAYTNFNSTCYLFSCTDRFYDNLEILIDFVQSPYLTNDNVEKEKGIIEQEIRMYEDNPNWRVFFNSLKCLYNEHPVKIDIAGTVDSIYKITKEDLYNCYNTFYVPNNMIVFIVGDVNKEECIKTIKNNIKNDFVKSDRDIERILPKEGEGIHKKVTKEELSVSMPLFNIAFKDTELSLKGKDLLKKEIEIKILLELIFGKSSDLYNKLYDVGLINETFENEYTYDISYGHSILGGESKNPEKVYDIICKELISIGENGINHDDFERLKKKAIGQHISSYNSLEFIANTFVAYYFKGINIFDYIEELNNLSIERVNQRLLQHFDIEKSILSVVMPN